MTQLLAIHPQNPQQRLIEQVADSVRKGGVIAYPTDSAYALGCQLGDKSALTRIQTIRQLDKHHNFTLICRNLADLGTYARVDNQMFRLLKAYTPGPYTFILPASSEVPRRLQHPKRKTIGLRIPDNAIVDKLLTTLAEPLMSVTLILPEHELPLTDPAQIYHYLNGKVDIVIDGGYCAVELTTVVDLTASQPKIVRMGKGDAKPFQA